MLLNKNIKVDTIFKDNSNDFDIAVNNYLSLGWTIDSQDIRIVPVSSQLGAKIYFVAIMTKNISEKQNEKG